MEKKMRSSHSAHCGDRSCSGDVACRERRRICRLRLTRIRLAK